MKKVYLVLSDCGDGSSSINWFRNTSLEELREMENDNPEVWSSGDGLQYQELNFPDNFDLDQFAELNHIYWEFE